MALATRPKPKVQHKKRKAQHHRQGKHYMKTYLPYLPMAAVVGLGALINDKWSTSLVSLDPGSATRIQALSGENANLALLTVIALAGTAAAVFVFLHWRRWHGVINRGERFVIKHPLLDLVLVIIFTTGVILTRNTI